MMMSTLQEQFYRDCTKVGYVPGDDKPIVARDSNGDWVVMQVAWDEEITVTRFYVARGEWEFAPFYIGFSREKANAVFIKHLV